MSRILVHEPRQSHEEWSALLGGGGRDVVVCPNRESLVAAMERRRPDVLVYVFSDVVRDLDLLSNLRGVSATLRIILVDGPADLATRRCIQELKPTYYGVSPLERDELSDVVSSALDRIGVR